MEEVLLYGDSSFKRSSVKVFQETLRGGRTFQKYLQKKTFKEGPLKCT